MNFYKNLRTIKRPIPDVLANKNYFVDLPGDWHVVIADINNSTDAVNTGKHEDVNMIAAGCLVVALNITKLLQVEIPCFFGGDGGTVLVPDEVLDEVVAALNVHRVNSLKNFSLELRVGSISVAAIRDAGYQVKLAKVEESPGFNKPLLIGNGLKYAEQAIKKIHEAERQQPVKDFEDFEKGSLNLEGMECKWNMVKPPAADLEVVCFLIEAVEEKNQHAVYSAVLKKLEEIYGQVDKRHPISMKMLILKNSFKKIRTEMIALYSKWKPLYFLKTWIRTFVGKLYFKFNWNVNNLKASDYLLQLIAFSEILTIDGRINTIVTGTAQSRSRFVAYLQEQERKKLLVFGHFVSVASIMTCYVENMNNKHIHFIDGADGGYTEASKELKAKLSS